MCLCHYSNFLADAVCVQELFPIMSLSTCELQALGILALVEVGFEEGDAATCKWSLPAHFPCYQHNCMCQWSLHV